MSDQDLIDLAMRVVQETRSLAAELNMTPLPVDEKPAQPPPLPAATARAPSPNAPVKRLKTVDELAAMILADLREVEGCPKRGLQVTVYGSNPWNAWLAFGPEVGAMRNRTEVQTICATIVERLKRLYDISD